VLRLKFVSSAIALALLAILRGVSACAQNTTPAANPGRPTITSPATLPPVGYLQFEQGYLGSFGSPETDQQQGVNQVTKIAVHPRLLLQAQFQPFAATKALGDSAYAHGFGDVLLGVQGVLYTPAVHHPAATSTAPRTEPEGEPSEAKPKLAALSLGYLGRVHSGTPGDIDLGSYSHSLILLLSGDLGGFHYDTNFLLNEQTDGRVRRAQTAQTLAVTHSIGTDALQLCVELYHYTQPLVTSDDYGRSVSRANLVDLLIAPSYEIRPNLVLDAGFSRGLTSTSTRWQAFTGFTYLLPHRLW
jgi:hypothetical protein